MSSGREEWEQWLASIQADLEHGREARENPGWVAISERVLYLASTLLRRHDVWTLDPEDVAQDVLLRLYSTPALRRIRASGSPEGYLVTIIRNRIFDELRRNRHKWRGEEPLSDWEERYAHPDRQHLSLDEQIALDRVLDELSEDDWMLIHLRFWHDRSISDIAQDLGITYSATSVRLFRLLRKLRQRMES